MFQLENVLGLVPSYYRNPSLHSSNHLYGNISLIHNGFSKSTTVIANWLWIQCVTVTWVEILSILFNRSTMVYKMLHSVLHKLGPQHLHDFKRHVEYHQRVPATRLRAASAHDTVQHHGHQDALMITLHALKEMNKRRLIRHLKELAREGNNCACSSPHVHYSRHLQMNHSHRHMPWPKH